MPKSSSQEPDPKKVSPSRKIMAKTKTEVDKKKAPSDKPPLKSSKKTSLQPQKVQGNTLERETELLVQESVTKNNADAKGGIIWIILTFLLIFIFGGYLLYEYQPDVHVKVENFMAQNGLGNTTEQTQEKIITLPLVIVHDLSDIQGQQAIKDKFVQSLVDPQKGLKATVIKDSWIDAKSTEGQQYLAEFDAKYLPLAFFDKTVEQHPQYNDLKNYLEKKNDHYYFHLSPLKHLKTPELTGGHTKGADPQNAPIVIIEYASFTCGFCKDMVPFLDQALKDYPEKIALVYKHFDRRPFNGTDVDNLLSQGTECANDQNKFWELHDELFKDQEGFLKSMQGSEKAIDVAVRDYLESKVTTVGLKSEEFLSCYDSKKYAKVAADTTAEAIKYGVNGTPAYFINGKFYDGSFQQYDKLKAVLDEALASGKK